MKKIVDWLANLWHDHKVIFFLLLPITLVAVGIKLYMDYNYMAAKESLEDTEKDTQKLKEEQKRLEEESEEHKKKADKAAERVDKRNENDDLDLDWHKRDDE